MTQDKAVPELDEQFYQEVWCYSDRVRELFRLSYANLEQLPYTWALRIKAIVRKVLREVLPVALA